MKATIKVEKEVELKFIQVQAKVRYWEDGEINEVSDEDGKMPCRDGDNWSPKIEIDTGKIVNWAQGINASVHYKVCDCCFVELIDAEGNVFFDSDGYVPGFLAIEDYGYGDYIIMNINEDGIIKGWNFTKHNLELLMEQD